MNSRLDQVAKLIRETETKRESGFSHHNTP